ncbi:hypothetical protein [Sinorhizobium meliloti]|uniref:hypothetical protein n=1 Tax=Rhizobium meliloti TaxID=382 RepID=UPI0013E364EA|nr:hypothetical protein [Sinorhizobium meliloti]
MTQAMSVHLFPRQAFVFSQELYRDFAILIGQFLKEEFQVGGIVEISASDRDLIAVMRRYFALRPSWRA